VPVGPTALDRRPKSARPRGFDEVLRQFRQHGHELKSNRGGFITTCPLHRDRRPSLQISCAQDGRTALVFCHSCKGRTQQILAAVGLTLADLWPEDPVGARTRLVREVVASTGALAWRRRTNSSASNSVGMPSIKDQVAENAQSF
jgi:hypothetical protein